MTVLAAKERKMIRNLNEKPGMLDAEGTKDKIKKNTSWYTDTAHIELKNSKIKFEDGERLDDPMT
jgi:hypothetical protein